MQWIAENQIISKLIKLIESKFCGLRSSRPEEACNFIKKETLAQVFSCEFCKNYSKNTFSYRTPPVATSETLFLIGLEYS